MQGRRCFRAVLGHPPQAREVPGLRREVADARADDRVERVERVVEADHLDEALLGHVDSPAAAFVVEGVSAPEQRGGSRRHRDGASLEIGERHGPGTGGEGARDHLLVHADDGVLPVAPGALGAEPLEEFRVVHPDAYVGEYGACFPVGARQLLRRQQRHGPSPSRTSTHHRVPALRRQGTARGSFTGRPSRTDAYPASTISSTRRPPAPSAPYRGSRSSLTHVMKWSISSTQPWLRRSSGIG